VIARALADRGVDRVVVPLGLLGGIAAASIAAGVLASSLPARRAVRVPMLDAVAANPG
jgi:putative ABC transport system permease protein